MAATTATVISMPRPKAKPSAKAVAKWGQDVWELGFNSIPAILFHGQRRLGLSLPNHMCVLLQLTDFWWDAGRKPFPSKRELSIRMKLSERQVQRIIADLEMKGYVQRIERRLPKRGKTSNEYDLSGLVKALAKLAPEFKQAREDAKARRAELATPIHLRRKATS
ncbi:MAG: helix-turn-helix domain-containing protein [Hyphomicrobiales bacterium]